MTRVGLLLVGHVDEKSQSVAGDYPELFASLLGPFGVELVPYALADGQFPESLHECDGWLCSPSRHSVSDDLPWIADAAALHREIVYGEHAYVGICFGHQLLAHALGGTVERAAQGWGVGVHEYTMIEQLRCMEPSLDRVALIASHQDQVVDVPAEVRVIATSQHCRIAGLAVGDRAWTLQGHPEFVPALADHLLAGRIELIGAERVARARTTLDRPLDRTTVARWIARFFASDADSRS